MNVRGVGPGLLLLAACGGGNAASRPDCSPGQTVLDGTCVSQQVADYVGCVRATGATVSNEDQRSLSAAAGFAGVRASTQGEVRDKLEKKYASVSDANALEIIHACDKRTAASGAQAATTLPAGSYLRSCMQCSMNWGDDILSCACKTRSGSMVSKTLRDASKCKTDIANCNGGLLCGGCL